MRLKCKLFSACISLLVPFLAQANLNPCEECPDPQHTGDVYESDCWYHSGEVTDCAYARRNNLWGVWLPEGPPIFRPFMADPRQVTYSVGWRFYDKVFGNNIIPVSYGDVLPIFRWCDLWGCRGDLEFDIEGALWALFDPLHESSPLIDADYYVGFPLTYAFGDWSFKLKGYHISTHIGDEYLLNHPYFHRKNPSIEAFDFFVSNQFNQNLRLYGGIGWVACQDDSYKVGPLYLQGGFEYRAFQFSYKDYCNRLYGVPFLAVNLYYQSHFHDRVNTTAVAGYEWGKVSGNRRRFRIFVEYHNGYAVEGQFSKCKNEYIAIRTSYGY